MIKWGLSLAFLVVAGGVEAGQCIRFSMDVVKVDDAFDRVEVVNTSSGKPLKYGDKFVVEVHGERPGTYEIWSIAPDGTKELFQQVETSGGQVVLPCGPKGFTSSCPGELPGTPFLLEDRLGAAGRPDTEREMLFVSYRPCRPDGTPAGEDRIPACSVVLDPDRDMARAYDNIGTEEAIVLFRRDKDKVKKPGCGYDKDVDGNVIIHRSIQISAER